MNADHIPAGEFMSAEEAAALLDGFEDACQRIDLTERRWCDRCLNSTAVLWTRHVVSVDQDGATAVEVGRAWFCVDHEDFLP